MIDMNSNATLDMLKQIASGLAAQFGENCEVLIHDIQKDSPESSIVYIVNGHLTNRKIGDGPSRDILNAMKHNNGHLPDKLAYLTRTEGGRILKSSTIYIHDEADKPCYILSINYDITNLLAIENSLHGLTACAASDDAGSNPQLITHDVNHLLDELIEQSVALVGVPVPLMSKEDKIKAINFLNDAGAFLITKSGDKVARYFGISKYTLYSYVDINK